MNDYRLIIVLALFCLTGCSRFDSDEYSFTTEPELLTSYYLNPFSDSYIAETQIINYKYIEKSILEVGHCWSNTDTIPTIWSLKENCEVIVPNYYDRSEYYIETNLKLGIDNFLYLRSYLILNDSITIYGNVILIEKRDK